MAGSSGFLGGHLSHRLKRHGHDITRLVRRAPTANNEARWDPDGGDWDSTVISGADAIINLCGVGVADKRWTPEYKELIRSSRVNPTRELATAAARHGCPALLNASAIGWYGDTGPREVDETAPPAKDFLGDIAVSWESATEPARSAGARVVNLRTGHVISSDSVMMKRLLPVFKLGLGGRFGSGRQYFPWVSLEDWLGAVEFALSSDLDGPVNLVGPQPATNARFAQALGRALRRPAIWSIPGFALRIVAGEAAIELVRGAKIDPKVLRDNGYEFRHPTIEDAARWAVGG